MATRKKKDELPPCLHCSKVFHVAVKFCTKCEDHMSAGSFTHSKDICDQCHASKNDEYIAMRKGSPERVLKALEHMRDEKNWGDNSVVEAYQKWIDSPDYAGRFGR